MSISPAIIFATWTGKISARIVAQMFEDIHLVGGALGASLAMVLAVTAQRIAIVFGALFAIWLGWRLLHPVHTYRFRLTVEAERNGTKHAGSSVIELRTKRNLLLSLLPEVPPWETSVAGEAVFIDLGGDDHLIALLPGPNSGFTTAALPSRAVLGDKTARTGPSGLFDTLSTLHRRELSASYGRSFPLTAEQMPPLIRFARIADPTSVEKAFPAEFAVTARLELTHDAVTRTLVGRLPWLDRSQPGRNLSGRNGSTWNAGEKPFSTPNQITFGDLVSEQ